MNRQLAKFIQENCLRNPTQFGFQLEHNTETTLIKATEEIMAEMERGSAAVLILLHLSAAIDIVDHKLLMKRLGVLGIKDSALALLTSFLVDRVQAMAREHFESAPFSLPCGVPQGSSLSPTLC